MRDLVLLAGGYGIDTMSASAVRALGLAHMLQSLGYRVIVLGKFAQLTDAARTPAGVLIDEVVCRDITQPVAGRNCPDYVSSSAALMQVADEQGPDTVRAILCYNYPARGAWSTMRQARRRGIATILDCTEWYGWEGRKVRRNLWRLSGVETRLRILTRLAGNVICASRWFRRRVAAQHTALLPFVVDTTRPTWSRGPAPDPAKPPHLVYSGSPGPGMHKDRLPIMIEALSRMVSEGHGFRVSIAGMSREQYLAAVPDHASCLRILDDRCRFLGRIPHEQSLALLRSADFSLFFRKPNRVSHTGFPTKYMEAATLGVPVISNPTSDIALYLRDGENGILARSFSSADITEALRRAVRLSPAEREAMVRACREQNPFDMRGWQEDARRFMQNLRGLDE